MTNTSNLTTKGSLCELSKNLSKIIEVSFQISSCYKDVILTSFPLWPNCSLLVAGK